VTKYKVAKETEVNSARHLQQWIEVRDRLESTQPAGGANTPAPMWNAIESRSGEDGENRPVPQAPVGGGVQGVQEGLGLLRGEPVPRSTPLEASPSRA
jgi:hypothetical protein